MAEKENYLDFNEDDFVLDEFIKNEQNKGYDNSIDILDKVNISGIDKNIINKIESKGKQYIITTYYDKNTKKNIIEVYVNNLGEFIEPESDDEIYKLVLEVLKIRSYK